MPEVLWRALTPLFLCRKHLTTGVRSVTARETLLSACATPTAEGVTGPGDAAPNASVSVRHEGAGGPGPRRPRDGERLRQRVGDRASRDRRTFRWGRESPSLVVSAENECLDGKPVPTHPCRADDGLRGRPRPQRLTRRWVVPLTQGCSSQGFLLWVCGGRRAPDPTLGFTAPKGV